MIGGFSAPDRPAPSLGEHPIAEISEDWAEWDDENVSRRAGLAVVALDDASRVAADERHVAIEALDVDAIAKGVEHEGVADSERIRPSAKASHSRAQHRQRDNVREGQG
jgi:hypothetical protein